MVVRRTEMGNRPYQHLTDLKHVKHGCGPQNQPPGMPREGLRYAAFIPDDVAPARMGPGKGGSHP